MTKNAQFNSLVCDAAEALFEYRVVGNTPIAMTCESAAFRAAWADLGEALYGPDDPRVRSLRGETPKTDTFREALRQAASGTLKPPTSEAAKAAIFRESLRRTRGPADSTLNMAALDGEDEQ